MLRNPINATRRAFTLLEMLLTLTIISLLASMVIPMLGDQDRLRLTAATTVLTSDVELAQVMTITNPQDPVVVRFDPANDRYWLAYQSDPATPILRSDTDEPYLVVLGEGRAAGAVGASLTVAGLTEDTLTFNAQGGLVDLTATPTITLTLNGKTINLAIGPTTGTITQTSE